MENNMEKKMDNHICPWWIGYFLLSPLRKLRQDPKKILAPHVSEGVTCLDAGSAMGYFSLPMASLVGPAGKVYCVDLQERMLATLRRRAVRAGLENIIDTIRATGASLNIDMLKESVDFALAFAVVHEVPDADVFFREMALAVRKGGRLLFAEPAGHVSRGHFEVSLGKAHAAGFHEEESLNLWRSHAVILKRK